MSRRPAQPEFRELPADADLVAEAEIVTDEPDGELLVAAMIAANDGCEPQAGPDDECAPAKPLGPVRVAR